MESKLQQIRNRLIDSILLVTSIIAIPTIIALLIRSIDTGWQWVYFFQSILTLSIVLIYFIRSKLTVAVKTHFVSITFIVLSFLGAIKFSLSGMYFLCLIPVIINKFILGKRTGNIYTAIVITGLIIAGIIHSNKLINTGIDFNSYNFSSTSWINVLTALISLMLLFNYSIGWFYDFYSQNIIALEEKSKEQEDSRNKLHLSEERYRVLTDNIPYPIIVSTYQGELLFINSYAEQYFGISSNNLKERNTKEFWVNNKNRSEYMDELEQKGKIQNREVELNSRNDGIKTVLLSSNRIVYQGQDTVFSVFNDITEQKNARTVLIQAKEKAEENERLKSAFLSNMSHEIRTPMNSIIGFAELLKEPNLAGETQQEFIGIIEKSGERLLSTINNIIDFSKIESGMVSVNSNKSNINEQIEFTYTFFKPEVEGKGLQFFVEKGLTLSEAFIYTDFEKIFAILVNLIKNAIKFCDKGAIEFGYKKKGKYLEFYVKDTGIGVPGNRQKAIFERFVQADISDTRAFQGSGLGLSISKSYAEMLDGEMWLKSEEGKGSTFYFTIPYHPVEEEELPIKNTVIEKDKEVHSKKLKVLIAEDDEPSRDLLAKRIEKLSREILYARTGVEAVAACSENNDLDLILMDIKMPEMDGHEATRQIRQFNKEIIIIAQTSYGFASDRVKAIEAGCNDYISKPINYNALYEFIRMLFAEKI
jgi:PAS domain S-box-containing protein